MQIYHETSQIWLFHYHHYCFYGEPYLWIWFCIPIDSQVDLIFKNYSGKEEIPPFWFVISFPQNQVLLVYHLGILFLQQED